MRGVAHSFRVRGLAVRDLRRSRESFLGRKSFPGIGCFRGCGARRAAGADRFTLSLTPRTALSSAIVGAAAWAEAIPATTLEALATSAPCEGETGAKASRAAFASGEAPFGACAAAGAAAVPPAQQTLNLPPQILATQLLCETLSLSFEGSPPAAQAVHVTLPDLVLVSAAASVPWGGAAAPAASLVAFASAEAAFGSFIAAGFEASTRVDGEAEPSVPEEGRAESEAAFAPGDAPSGTSAAVGAGTASPGLAISARSCGRSVLQPNSLAKRKASSLEKLLRNFASRSASRLQTSSGASPEASVLEEGRAATRFASGDAPVETSAAASAGASSRVDALASVLGDG